MWQPRCTQPVWLKWGPLPKAIYLFCPSGSSSVKRNKGEVNVRADTRATTWSLRDQRRDRVGSTWAQLCGWGRVATASLVFPSPKTETSQLSTS